MKSDKSQSLLRSITLPDDLKKLSFEKIDLLCHEIRQEIIKTVSVNGGHLASNLGVVELTVALYRIFDMPKDKIVWDVGHQCYTNKILTGRLDSLNTIRKEGGISGFPKRMESEYDCFDVGHSSTSISAALGLATAASINNEDRKVIAVIGDGALSGGMAFEGLNNAGRFKKNFIVILNDNKMSISRNVGSMARYLTTMRTKPTYIRAKNNLDKVLVKTPIVGTSIQNICLKSKEAVKHLLYNKTIFEELGFNYYGPIDGHDIIKLCEVLNVAKQAKKPVLIHIITKKGKGYQFAEENPKAFHGVSAFDIRTGTSSTSSKNYSSVFGKLVCKLAKEDKRICAITAAMTTGTGLSMFCREYKDRFFDVGIAEEHAVTFAAGLSIGGMVPIFAVYSSFLQRSYDQIIHDAALQNTKMILAIDRAGVVGEDGETHQGLFDVAMLNAIPRTTIYAPSYFCEMEPFFKDAIYNQPGICAIRYPRGSEGYKPSYYKLSEKAFDTYFESNIVVLTYGRLFCDACKARDELSHMGVKVKLIKLNRIKPLEISLLKEVINAKFVFFFEEGIKTGSIGESLAFKLLENNFKGKYILTAVDNKFVSQASVESSLKKLGLDFNSMKNKILKVINNN